MPSHLPRLAMEGLAVFLCEMLSHLPRLAMEGLTVFLGRAPEMFTALQSQLSRPRSSRINGRRGAVQVSMFSFASSFQLFNAALILCCRPPRTPLAIAATRDASLGRCAVTIYNMAV